MLREVVKLREVNKDLGEKNNILSEEIKLVRS